MSHYFLAVYPMDCLVSRELGWPVAPVWRTMRAASRIIKRVVISLG